MRCDLLQWDQAIQLASSLAPYRLPAISREYAQQLEFLYVIGFTLSTPLLCSLSLSWITFVGDRGDHSAALVYYEKGLSDSHEVCLSHPISYLWSCDHSSGFRPWPTLSEWNSQGCTAHWGHKEVCDAIYSGTSLLRMLWIKYSFLLRTFVLVP